MEDPHTQTLQWEIEQLLRKQKEVLDSRMLGTANDTDLLEYEVRQEIIHDLCQELCALISGAGPTHFRR